MLYGIDEDYWAIWVEWRRKEKRKKVTETAAKLQRRKLSKYPPPIQRQMIEQSIENDYQGLFEVKNATRQHSTASRPAIAAAISGTF